MLTNSRKITPIEHRYVEKLMSGIQFGMKNAKYGFLLILLIGVIALFALDVPLIGLGLFFIGLAGFIFFHHFSAPIKFEILPETVWQKGNIKFKLIGVGKSRGFAPFLGKKRLFCPAVFDLPLHAIANKKNPVNVEMAICQYTRKNESAQFHIPLRIDNKLCVLSALNKYGIRFTLLPTLLFVLKLLGGVVCFGVLAFPVYALSSLFDEHWKVIIFIIGLVPAVFMGFWVAFKLLPDDDVIIKHRLNCNTSH